MAEQKLFSTGFQYYQSANADAEDIKKDFLIRLNEFSIILDDIRRQPATGAVQHFLLIGRRGSGKSTLLKRLQIELETDPVLLKRYISINLAEEQANIYKLHDFLDSIIDELQYHGIDVVSSEWKDDIHLYARDLFGAIHQALTKTGKKLVLLLDNIDRIFENLDEDASLLREYLLNYDDLKIIGGSTKLTEHFWQHNKPFYQFFRVLELNKLSSIEIKTLLLSWAERLELPQLRDFVNNRGGQIETVRLLTDGLPRTLQFFVNILLTRTQETGYEYLRLIMDNVTPLYQERLNSLPPSQRKIVLQMAFLWEGVGAKEISEVTKMDTKVISAQLKQLANKGLVDKVETGSKNHLYRISERFFNLWLIFTQGSPKEKRKAKCLTIFLENFYDAQEIVRIANEHLNLLQSGKTAANKAALITKALAQSRHISFVMRDKLINNTLELHGIANELRLQMPPTSRQIFDDINGALDAGDSNRALRIAAEVEHDDGYREFLQGYVHRFGNNHKEGQKVLQMAFDNGFKACAGWLAQEYLAVGQLQLAEKFFKIADEMKLPNAGIELGEFYTDQKQFENAKEVFLREVESGEWKASIRLAAVYFQEDNYKQAEKYYQVGVDNEVIGSAIGLAMIYHFQNINKDKAREMVLLERKWAGESKFPFEVLSILVDVWNGNLADLQRRVEQVILDDGFDNSSLLISVLLTHYQVNIVMRLFESTGFGRELKEHNLPIYYAALQLLNKDQNVDLKVPPEIQEVVQKELEEVYNMRLVYYPEQKQ